MVLRAYSNGCGGTARESDLRGGHGAFMTTKTLKVGPVTGGGVNALPTGAGGVTPAMGSSIWPPWKTPLPTGLP